jgi:hypothetical protein
VGRVKIKDDAGIVHELDTDAPAPVAVPNGDNPPKPEESKADKFKRLATWRLFKVEKALGALANLANRNIYEFTDGQKDIVQRSISEMCAQCYNSFEKRAAPERGKDYGL